MGTQKNIAAKIIEDFGTHDVVVANFANADLVGHAGDFRSAVQAVEILDEQIGEIMNVVLNGDAVLVITADHGNIELKRDVVSGEKRTEHSINSVPFYLVGNRFRRKTPQSEDTIKKIKSEASGILTDVAPTILEILGIKKPHEMTVKSLLKNMESEK